MKNLFEYQINTISEEEVTEVQENGDKVIKKVQKTIPVKVIIKEPNRKHVEAARDVYHREWSRAVKNGIVTRAIVDKAYRGQNGILTDKENQNLEEIGARIKEIREQYLELDKKEIKSDEDNEKIKELYQEFTVVQGQLDSLEEINESLYANTAENISKNKENLYNILFLSGIERGGQIVPVVDGEDLETRLNKLDQILADDSSPAAKIKSELFGKIIDRNSYYINLLTKGKIQVSQLPEINEKIDSGEIKI